jgi:hypothetical protein
MYGSRSLSWKKSHQLVMPACIPVSQTAQPIIVHLSSRDRIHWPRKDTRTEGKGHDTKKLRARADLLSLGMRLHRQVVTSALVRNGRDAPRDAHNVNHDGRTPSSEMASWRDWQSDELRARREISV